ncbi:MAG: alpha/beta fold hydrolase [Actinomycetota bacterium]|nr:alpha/beta fold hydrolase [Actinomycetota bacterium]
MRDPHPLPGADVVVEGTRLHVVGHGRQQGPPVLLLHGLPTSSYLWRDVMRDLEHDHRTVAPDLVGLGASERPAHRRYDLSSQALLLLALLDELRLPRVAVVGHDLGGSIAVHMAALAPDRVAALVLVDAPVHADVWPVPPVLPLLAPGLGEAYAAGLRLAPALARAVLARGLGAGGTGAGALEPRELDHYLSPLLTPAGSRGLLRLARAVDLVSVEAAWQLVRQAPPPALVLWGEGDRLHSTAYGRRVAGELPGASWVPVADAGHLLPQQRPERVAEELAAFLADAGTGMPTPVG